MLTLNAAKANFFDRKVVMDAVDRARRGNLSKFGAFCMRRAKSSIRKRKRVSEPGQPPSSRTGLLKDFIFFAYDPGRQSVVIGPIKLNAVGNAPQALEEGGASMTYVGRRGNRKVKVIQIEARPYMAPAFEATKQELPAIWRDSVK